VKNFDSVSFGVAEDLLCSSSWTCVCCIIKADAQFVCICTAVTTPFLILWILGQKIFLVYFIELF